MDAPAQGISIQGPASHNHLCTECFQVFPEIVGIAIRSSSGIASANRPSNRASQSLRAALFADAMLARACGGNWICHCMATHDDHELQLAWQTTETLVLEYYHRLRSRFAPPAHEACSLVQTSCRFLYARKCAQHGLALEPNLTKCLRADACSVARTRQVSRAVQGASCRSRAHPRNGMHMCSGCSTFTVSSFFGGAIAAAGCPQAPSQA